MQPEFSIDGYRAFVMAFNDAGYDFRKFDDYIGDDKGHYVYFRHDVDLCVEAAKEIAEVESELGVKSTFFFQLRSPLYNLLSPYVIRHIERMHQLGHDIALHFNPNFYLGSTEVFSADLIRELNCFGDFFPNLNRSIVSFHKVGASAHDLRTMQLINDISHTYEERFFGQVAYYSDSTGRWRYGNPLEAEAFKRLQPMQVLTHPVWWVYDGDDPISKIKKMLFDLCNRDTHHIEETAISFKLHLG
jgi:hypothetical protein